MNGEATGAAEGGGTNEDGGTIGKDETVAGPGMKLRGDTSTSLGIITTSLIKEKEIGHTS